MSPSLKTYRLCCFDAAHNIVTADWIEAFDDAEAVAKAEATGFGTKCEVWDGRRLVAELAAKRRQA